MEQQGAEPPQWRARVVAVVFVGGLAALLVYGLVAYLAKGSSGRAEAAAPADRSTRTVSQADFQEWPFSVGGGVLRCRQGAVTFTVAGGAEYGVNGTAKGLGYPEPIPIWVDDPELGQGVKISIGEVLDAGLVLC
ncbi:YebY family protein [Streptomyces phaeochromogenes]|uniref:DUF2511 domain-containing protein n=1 Tax=Streptomyces phaeochromogenes TaxID=1923 RepID=UPI00224DE1E7|nr:DUF2511 domain-containing protein [Streptomyces phaeochromogenes]MCX5601609.1 YebY family protein [Streptomyces phaeochromogenes]